MSMAPERKENSLGMLRIRLETIAMSQLSYFGQEIAIAKMRHTNPVLL